MRFNIDKIGKFKITRFIISCLLIIFLPIILFDATAAPKYERNNKRNLFIPYVASDGQLINIKEETTNTDIAINLEGIIYDESGQSMVIINGEILKEGDSLGDVKILEIRKEKVVYIKNGEVLAIDARREE